MKTDLTSRLRRLAAALTPQLSDWRRQIHMQPEASMQEHDTAAFVVARLREIGAEDIRTGVGETGVTALIRGKGRKTVGLRADMDALELQEKNPVPYRSRRPGMMHACGHDGHVAGLLGVAALLQQVREEIPGQVKLVFQPGEEGAGGAARMIADGVLENPKVSAMAALHVSTDFPAGRIGVGRGYATAQVDDVYMTIVGKSGHAARPDGGVDAIAVASQALIAIQQFIGRHTNAMDRKLLTIGVIHGGTRHNILADAVELIGTVRTLEPEGREKVLNFVTKDLRKLVGAMGAGLKVRIEHGYPPSINDDRVADIFEAAGRDLLGAEGVMPRDRAVLGGEDFAYFGRTGIPAAMLDLGIYDEAKGFTAPGHNSRFDFDDRQVLPIGAALLADSAIRMLREL